MKVLGYVVFDGGEVIGCWGNAAEPFVDLAHVSDELDVDDVICALVPVADLDGMQTVWGTRDPADGFCSLRVGEDAAREYAAEHGHEVIAYWATGWQAVS